jgi:hypothetical protein
VRDRRWDFLYDRQRQPVRTYVLERFAEELASELSAWPPPFVEWVSDDLRTRWAAGVAEKPQARVVRLALSLAKLDLAREFELEEKLLDREGPSAWQTDADRAAGHLVVRYVTERCLGLKEHADAMRLTRAELIGAVELAEKKLEAPVSNAT